MLKRSNVLLCVIDLQDGLLPRIDGAEGIVAQSVKLIRFARALDLPVIYTEQYPKGLGRTTERVAAELAGCVPLEKVSFGCFDGPGFEEAVQATGRTQMVVAGIEAHVCVMQTVLAGMERHYEMFVVRDAVGSRHPADCQAGIDRMRTEGAAIATTEMVLFEILRAAGTPEFKKVLPLIK